MQQEFPEEKPLKVNPLTFEELLEMKMSQKPGVGGLGLVRENSIQ